MWDGTMLSLSFLAMVPLKWQLKERAVFFKCMVVTTMQFLLLRYLFFTCFPFFKVNYYYVFKSDLLN